MSSKLKPRKNNKKNEQSAKRIKFWSIALCAGVLVIATILILIRMGVFESDEFDPAGRYEVTHITDPTTGITTPVEELEEAMEMVDPGQALIEIELKKDGTFSFTPNFDMMIYYEGKYEVNGHDISMTADDDTSGPITGTINAKNLTITDTEGYKMTFQKVQ